MPRTRVPNYETLQNVRVGFLNRFSLSWIEKNSLVKFVTTLSPRWLNTFCSVEVSVPLGMLKLCLVNREHRADFLDTTFLRDKVADSDFLRQMALRRRPEMSSALLANRSNFTKHDFSMILESTFHRFFIRALSSDKES